MPAKNTRARRLLIVVGGSFATVGGHYLSAMTLARYLTKHGHQVGLILARPACDVPELHQTAFETYHVPYSGNGRAYVSQPYLQRPGEVWKVVCKMRCEAIVAMDWPSAIQSSGAAMLYGLPLIQVIAGGIVPHTAPLKLPGIVVFSTELLDGLQRQHGFSPDALTYCAGRVDFDYFEAPAAPEARSTLFGREIAIPAILAVSRLSTDSKSQAIHALLAQVEQAANRRELQLVIIGDGSGRPALERHAEMVRQKTAGRATISFVGSLRVTPDILREGNIVVGQGRTVIEAIASGVPAAVCGEGGYFGLVTPSTLTSFATTNLTGRRLQTMSTLDEDLQRLDFHRDAELPETRALARALYSADGGANALVQALAQFEERLTTPASRRSLIARAYCRSAMNYLVHWFLRHVVRLGRFSPIDGHTTCL